jgi:hypothetical protein
MPRTRVDGLLASFPKLIPANSQHTTVETADVRFVYQPFEELYVLLITNKGSNILQVSTKQDHESCLHPNFAHTLLGHCNSVPPRSTHLIPYSSHVGTSHSSSQL